MLYALKFYSNLCQLFLNKIGRKQGLILKYLIDIQTRRTTDPPLGKLIIPIPIKSSGLLYYKNLHQCNAYKVKEVIFLLYKRSIIQ